MKPTYEELEAKLQATEVNLANTEVNLANTEVNLANTEAKLAETHRLLKLAIERIAALEERLNKNSKNSSKPPSSDRKANTDDPKKTRKSRGGINRALLPSDQVDRFQTCKLSHCPCCGFHKLIDQNHPLVLQQAELPEVKAIITQFNCTKYACVACGEKFFANLPSGVPNSAFGPRLMGLVATLTGVFHLAKREAMLLVRDLYGVTISEGSIINVEERVATAINEIYERIHQHVMESVFPKHFDETSWRNRGKNHYVWVASTSKAVCFRIEANRSKEAFQRFAANLVDAPVVTDRYSAYTHLQQPHQHCLAHLIRDFRKYAERDGPDSEIGKALEMELRKICKNHREFRENQISLSSRDARFRHQKKRLEEHLVDGLANGSDELSGLCERLLDEMHKLWTFSDFTNVDPTNNLAERDLRKLVLWRKKSYGTRSNRGQHFVERISTIAETLKRSCENIWAFITKAIKTFYSGEPAPFIGFALGF